MTRVWISFALILMAASLLAGDKHQRGFLGVTLENSAGAEGLRIIGVRPESAAEVAGILADDIIIELNGIEIDGHGDLNRAMKDLVAGDVANLVVLRNGNQTNLQVELGEHPGPVVWSGHKKSAYMLDPDRPFMGIDYEAVSGQLAAFFKVNGGILIKEVMAGTPAEAAGLQAGDILIAWDRESIKKGEDLTLAMRANKKDDVVTLTIVRSGERRELPITLGAAGDFHDASKFYSPKFNYNFNYNFSGENLHEEMKNLKKELHKMKQELKKEKKEGMQ